MAEQEFRKDGYYTVRLIGNNPVGQVEFHTLKSINGLLYTLDFRLVDSDEVLEVYIDSYFPLTKFKV